MEFRHRLGKQVAAKNMKFADRIYVLRTGRVQLHDRAANLREGNAIMSAYFGFEDRPAASATQSASR
jgi:branched-chain amino acid transport system ATP-binding protein